MPDFTYHPLFKPLLFSLSAETSRRITIELLALQGRTAPGRALFRAFARAAPPPEARVRAMGLVFPSRVGLAPGIDVEGTAAPVMQHLGFGFLVVGPAGSKRVLPVTETEPIRIAERHAIAWSGQQASPAASDLLARVRAGPPIAVPLGVALRDGDDLVESAERAGELADFLLLPSSCAGSRERLERLRGATKRPLVLSLAPEWDDGELGAALDRAGEAGMDGVLATDLARSPLVPLGALEGPFLLERALATAEHAARRVGDRLAVIGGGGIQTPDDALRFLDAGAHLVQLGAGFVYAGPGLPKRIVQAELSRTGPRPVAGAAPSKRRPVPLVAPAPEPALAVVASRAPFWSGWLLLAMTGLVLFGSGCLALVLAATVQLLPNDVHYLGVTVDELCARNACRIVHFMAHDRVSWGGSIMSIGILYVWMAARAVRRGEAWAWWAFVISGLIGFGSFLTYLGFGYLDRWHAAATLLLLPVYGLGLLASYSHLARPRSLVAALRSGAKASIWSPAGMGRACVSFAAFGMIAGGLTIMGVGMTRIFVPQDLEYMGLTVADLRAIHPRLVPLIAHDRAGFGGGLCSGGIAVMMTLWCGVRPGERSLWLALAMSGLIGFGAAIGVHPAVGYTSFVHLLPAYAGALAFLVGIAILRRPMLDPDPGRPAQSFPDV